MNAHKTAIVTGAAQGIGRAVAKHLSERNAHVVLGDTNEVEGQKLAEELNASAQKAIFVKTDVRVEDQVLNLVKTATDKFGGLDILVNNAGVMEFELIETTPTEMWNRTIEINLTGTFFCTKHSVPAMKLRGGGSIVNIASVHSVLTGPEAGAYAASKGGVLSLTRNMAIELGEHGIRVNAVLPGTIMTAMFLYAADKSGDRQQFVDAFKREIALRRIGKPEEVAKIVGFVCSDDASYVTGAAIAVDGGLTAQLSFPK